MPYTHWGTPIAHRRFGGIDLEILEMMDQNLFTQPVADPHVMTEGEGIVRIDVAMTIAGRQWHACPI